MVLVPVYARWRHSAAVLYDNGGCCFCKLGTKMSSTALGIKAFLGKILTAGNIDASNNGVHAADEAAARDVEERAIDLAFCVVDHYTGGMAGFKKLGRRTPSCSKTLLRMVDHMSERHQILFSR